MNDPEIIEKLEEIKQELSEMKHDVSWLCEVSQVVAGLIIGTTLLFFIIKVVIPWIRDFLF